LISGINGLLVREIDCPHKECVASTKKSFFGTKIRLCDNSMIMSDSVNPKGNVEIRIGGLSVLWEFVQVSTQPVAVRPKRGFFALA
jgi:hypothetical protein